MWSYCNDRADSVYSDSGGPAIVNGVPSGTPLPGATGGGPPGTAVVAQIAMLYAEIPI